MRIRSIDSSGDWNFGKGKNDYKKDISATAQNIKTRLKSFLGDCFFDLAAGIDWFYFNGNKEIDELKLAITANILNTQNVISANVINVSLGVNRVFLIQYDVNTIYGKINEELEVNYA